jgi:hypothetical protein
VLEYRESGYAVRIAIIRLRRKNKKKISKFAPFFDRGSTWLPSPFCRTCRIDARRVNDDYCIDAVGIGFSLELLKNRTRRLRQVSERFANG